MGDDNDKVKRAVAEVPAESESAKDSEAAADRRDEKAAAEEWLAPGLEEAGYGYGV